MIYLITIVCGLLGITEAKHAEHMTPGPVVNIVEWDSKELHKVYERPDQLPINRDDLILLAESGFQPKQLVEIVSQRRYAGDVSAPGLISLKSLGVADEVIQAASLHALPPNRSINLSVTLEIDGRASAPKSRYLYIVIPDGEIERVFTADLGQVSGGKWRSESVVDHSDLLIERSIRTVTFRGRIPLKVAGNKELTAFTSARPDIHWLAEISDTDRQKVRSHEFKYPKSSTRNDCRILIRLYQDQVLEDNWSIAGTHLECEWN
ncbi:MAG: hypothetical protein VX910_10965 [Candidatus Latescibacterota bacterium]|nr:hypothetical protein [Candidatus Latescibacterota bacterium]